MTDLDFRIAEREDDEDSGDWMQERNLINRENGLPDCDCFKRTCVCGIDEAREEGIRGNY